MFIVKSLSIRNGIIAGLLMIPIGAQAYSGLTFYSTRLTKHACYNSKRKRLYYVAQILRQERVLFHHREAQYYQRKKLSHQRKAQYYQRKKLPHLKKVMPYHAVKKHLIGPTQDESFFPCAIIEKFSQPQKLIFQKNCHLRLRNVPLWITPFMFIRKNIYRCAQG